MSFSKTEINSLIAKKIARLVVVFLMLLVAACGGDPYLYDRTGFDSDARPVVAPNPSAPRTSAPNYYPQQYNAPQYNPQYNQYQPVPVYQAPVYPQPVPAYQQPQGGSRYYTNPYAIPPSPGYYQRYDVDQYYVPPMYYEGGNNSGNGQQMRSTGYGNGSN